MVRAINALRIHLGAFLQLCMPPLSYWVKLQELETFLLLLKVAASSIFVNTKTLTKYGGSLGGLLKNCYNVLQFLNCLISFVLCKNERCGQHNVPILWVLHKPAWLVYQI